MPLEHRTGHDDPGVGLQPGQSVGVAIGIVVIIFFLLLFCCYLKCGICFLGSRAIGRRIRDEFHYGRSSYQKDPEMQRQWQHHSNAQYQHPQQQHIMTNWGLPRKPSTISSSQRYVDGTNELSVPDGMRHEIDGVGRSAATAPNRVEIDGTPVGPAELPTEPVAARQSWRTSADTLFHYTPRPSYLLSEDEESRRKSHVMSHSYPTSYQRWGQGRGNGGNGGLPPLMPAARKPVASLNNVVEEQSSGGDTTKEALLSEQEEEMLKRDRWSTWRNWGGGAGGNGTL